MNGSSQLRNETEASGPSPDREGGCRRGAGPWRLEKQGAVNALAKQGVETLILLCICFDAEDTSDAGGRSSGTGGGLRDFSEEGGDLEARSTRGEALDLETDDAADLALAGGQRRLGASYCRKLRKQTGRRGSPGRRKRQSRWR